MVDDVGEESAELLVGVGGRGEGGVSEGKQLFAKVLLDDLELLCAEGVPVFFADYKMHITID
jgi:hypothetical protein